MTIDMTAVADEQRLIWDAVSVGWERWQSQFERGAASVTSVLLQLGGVGPGQFVLDLGTGVGEPACTAVRAIGGNGRVLGVDPSAKMIAAARRRATGIGNISFATGELEAVGLPAGSFDVVLSRWALMFMADRGAVLRRLANLLKPGGILAAAVWSSPQSVPMISLGFAVISEQLSLSPPPPGVPGPFSMSNPEQVTEELTAAGFRDIKVCEHMVPFRFDSVLDFVDFSRDVLPPRMRQLLRDRRGCEHDPIIWQAVAQAAQRYTTADGGVFLPSTSLCLRAVAPGDSA